MAMAAARQKPGSSSRDGSSDRYPIRKSPTSWKTEVYGIFGMDVESGAPLRIGLFFAVINVLLRLLVVYFAYYLVTMDWLWRKCDDDESGVPGRSCEATCLTVSERGRLVGCGLMTAVNWSAFVISCTMLVFDVYIVLRLPITNRKRLKWMSRQYRLSLAFLVCEVICFIFFLVLLVLSILVSIAFATNEMLQTQPHGQGVNYLMGVGCYSMISLFIYMFVDWCSVCDLPQVKVH